MIMRALGSALALLAFGALMSVAFRELTTEVRAVVLGNIAVCALTSIALTLAAGDKK
jgi:hypothetical protein